MMKLLRKILLSWCLLISIISNVRGQTLNGQTSLTALAACASQTQFKVGDFCQFAYVLTIPAGITSSVLVQLYASDNGTSYMAQLCKPTITVGAGLGAVTPVLTFTPLAGTAQFYQATINFGTVTAATTDSITINFMTVVVDAGQASGTSIWVTAYAEYFGGSEVWIGQADLYFVTDGNPLNSAASTFTLLNTTESTSVGEFDTFTAVLTVDHWRYYQLQLVAQSTSPSTISVCSIHVYSANWCYSCLDSNKAYISSTPSLLTDVVNINLGFVPNIGINQGNATANSDIYILVTYQVLSTATVGSSGTVEITSNFVLSDASTRAYTVTGIVNFASAPTQISPALPAISPSYPGGSINIYQPFILQYTITFPSTFDSQVQVNATPTQSSYQIKICSVQVFSSGENLPCSKCMSNNAFTTLYSSIPGTMYDSALYVQTDVKNFNFRTTNDQANVNQMTFYITGQVLNNPLNTNGATVSIPVTFIFGSSTTWTQTATIIIGTTSTQTIPSFAFSIGDSGGTTAQIYSTRTLFFDVQTTANTVYESLNFQLIMPQSSGGSNLPAATICSVQMYYAGLYTTCVQQNYINNLNFQQINYYQTMVRYMNDQALVYMGNLCNSATTASANANNNLVRFAIYFQMENYANIGSSYAITLNVMDSTMTVLSTYSLTFTAAAASLTVPAAGSVYGYSNFTTAPIIGNSFGIATAVIKMVPGITALFNFESIISQPASGGTASFCRVFLNRRGTNIPCSDPFDDVYGYSSYSYVKAYETTESVSFCSINEANSTIYDLTNWDADSIEIDLLIRPSASANGPFTLTFNIFNTASVSVLTAPFSYTWNAVPYSGTTYSFNYAVTSSSIYGVNPVDSTQTYASTSTYNNMYMGETGIIRFQMIINEPNKFFDIKLALTSTLTPDQFEIVNFFISNVGDNFPCVSYLRPIVFTNGTYYPYAANLDMGNIAYYPIATTNISASTITVEAFIRVPLSSSISLPTTATFTIVPIVDTVPNATLTQTTGSITIASTASMTPSTTQTIPLPLTFVSLPAIYPVTVSTTLMLNVALNIPAYSNLDISMVMSCVDPMSNRQFANIKSAQIISMGRNINGLMSEYMHGFILPVYSRSATVYTGSQFYNDTVTFNFGVITNTLFGQKLGNYSSAVDDTLTVQFELLIIDESISNANSIYSVVLNTYTGLSSPNNVFTSTQQFEIERDTPDLPVININATILNDTSVVYSTGDMFYIQFTMQHDPTSTAEGYNVTAAFYLAPYITFNSLISCSPSSPVTQYSIDTGLFFNMVRLHFGEVMTCVFNVIIDQSALYSTYVNAFGDMPPTMLQIPYLVMYNKFPRVTDTVTEFWSTTKSVEYKPQPVAITAVPSFPLLSMLSSCQFTSSINGSNPSYATTIGWTTGYRSIFWYQSGSTYITISFGYSTIVSSILLTQLSGNGYTTPFSHFMVSFSNDGVSYAYLPEVLFPNAASSASFTYSMPNQYITCYYLRIHLTNVANTADLSSKTSGLIIGQIYGQILNSSTPIADPCATPAYSSYYAPRSYLYASDIQTLFVCDENVDRTSSECYSTTETNTTNWLVMSNIVSTIVYWVRDLETLSSYVYGVGNDKVSYLRTDDGGITWKAVSSTEFQMMLSAAQTNSAKYLFSYYSTLTVSAIPSATFGQWTVGVMGFYYNSALRLDWFS